MQPADTIQISGMCNISGHPIYLTERKENYSFATASLIKPNTVRKIKTNVFKNNAYTSNLTANF